MKDERKYVRVYYEIIDDPRFVGIFDNDHHLSTWLRLLLTADAVWPASAEVPRRIRQASFRALVDAGLVEWLSGDRFRIHGLDRERTRRAVAGRAGGLASGVSRRGGTETERPPNDRSAKARTNVEPEVNLDEPSIDEQRRAETSTSRARGDGERSDSLDDVLLWLSERKAQPAAGTKTHTTLCQLVDREGAPAVIAAMEGLGPQVEAAQYVFGARNALHPIPGAPTSPNGRRPPGGHTRTAAEVEDAFR